MTPLAIREVLGLRADLLHQIPAPFTLTLSNGMRSKAMDLGGELDPSRWLKLMDTAKRFGGWAGECVTVEDVLERVGLTVVDVEML